MTAYLGEQGEQTNQNDPTAFEADARLTVQFRRVPRPPASE